jgi:hypothetical protein
LEDERSERIERRKLVQPGPRAEIRSRVDQLGKDRIRVPKELTRFAIGKRCPLAGSGGHAMVLAAAR